MDITNATGGYKILDLSAYGSFEISIPKIVRGALEVLKEVPTKPLLITGLTIGAVDVPAFFTSFVLDTTSQAYIGYVGTKTISIYTNGSVTIKE